MTARGFPAPAKTVQEDLRTPMSRTRQQNVYAAQWSANGGALGAPDLTDPGAQTFGELVFSEAVQRQRLPKHVFRALQQTLASAGRWTRASRTRSRSR
jgi:hypothetical protein